MAKFKVITLCGSRKFKDDFKKIQEELSLKGYIVFSPVFFEKIPKESITINDICLLGMMHLQKIAMSDEIFVINKNGYIGESTKSEIDYAIKHNKIVNYLEPVNE